MRRADREVTDSARIQEIMEQCACCRIGFWDGQEVYIVPLSFGYEKTEAGYVLYFHGAEKGRKMELLHSRPAVGFEMDTGCEVSGTGDRGCSYGAWYQSLVGNGVLSLVENMEEKRKGLTLLMNHQAGRRNWQFDDRAVEKVCVFKLQVTSISGKKHPKMGGHGA